VVLYNITRDIL